MAKSASTDQRGRTPKAASGGGFERCLGDFGALSRAEKILLDSCRRGEIAFIAERPPEERSEGNSVRAAFVRFLAVAGEEAVAVHEHGVQLYGAWIDGLLDLRDACVDHPLLLLYCQAEEIQASQACLRLLNLSGMRIDGDLTASDLRCEHGLLLRNGFSIRGRVILVGADIGGNLECGMGRFEGKDGEALRCDGITVAGDVHLGRGFRAVGEVRLSGANIAGDLTCIGGVFENEKGFALSCNRATVTGGFFFRSIRELRGGLNLTSMSVGSLCDDQASWTGARGRMLLDGFTYERLTGRAPAGARRRIGWLDMQLPAHLDKTGFRPQPWEQLISVLRAMGHLEAARAVAVEKQTRLRKLGRLPYGTRPFHFLYGLLVGYGYRPLRLLVAVAAAWIIPALAYWAAVNPQWFGARAPILVPVSAQEATAPRNPLYRDFEAWAYSADVLLPVIDLGYASGWRPAIRDRQGRPLIWGRLLRYLHWFQILAGWVAGLLLIAVVRNLIKKD